MAPELYHTYQPDWCPHPDCVHIKTMVDTICGGRLTKPERHDDDFNTHRFCLKDAGGDGGVFDLQVNKSDLYWFSLLLGAIKDDMTLPTDAPEGEK